MEIKIRKFGEGGVEDRKIDPGTTIADLLRKMDFNLEAHVVNRNGEIAVEEEELEDGDELEVISVVSGG